MTPAHPSVRWRIFLAIAALATVTAAVAWAYWSTLLELTRRWAQDPQYSHGWLVPLFAVVLLWFRRDYLADSGPKPTWWGLPLLAGGILLRFIGAWFYFEWFDPISLVPCLAGAALMVGGKRVWKWAWPSIAFLAFMIPLPFRLANALSDPLQHLATLTSTFALQTLGLPALAEGNTIQMDDVQINIVEACSGLSMLIVFFAQSTAFALVVRRPLWEKGLIILSAIPIALASNILRITVTGVLYRFVSDKAADEFFHDVAGYIMPFLAFGMLWMELAVLGRLLISPSSVGPARVGAESTQVAIPPSRPRQPWKPANAAPSRAPVRAKPSVAPASKT
jgi:exosortase